MPQRFSSLGALVAIAALFNFQMAAAEESVDIAAADLAATDLASTDSAVASVAAADSCSPLSCCTALSALNIPVYSSNSAQYTASVQSYWSLTAQLTPWCIVTPRNTNEVAKVVTALTTKGRQCKFAVRSGGHMPWAGASNIEEGVTIDLSLLKAVTVNPGGTVSVQPGARWGDVYAELDQHNLAVVGGRASSVGTGGLVIGGGNSFYTARKGLVCDNVAEFEIVLASGKIITASAKTNADLFLALKGGHANFGIVTRMNLVTFASNGLWGGTVVLPASTTPQQLKAFENFARKIPDDPNASAISIWQYSSATDMTIVLNAFDYTEPVPNAPAYDEYLAIQPQLANSMRVTNMSDIIGELGVAYGDRQLFMTNTFELDAAVLAKSIELHDVAVATIKAGNPTGSWNYVSMIQPISPLFTKHSKDRGGNVVGLDQFGNKNLVMFLAFPSWDSAADDALFSRAIHTQIDNINKFAASRGKYNPWVYTNYADITQNPLAGYGAKNLAKIKAAAKKYDPNGVFQRLQPGGFKISAVA